MAKQLVNPVERHVEKAVLGITVLLLIGVMAKFLISTPNKMEFGGETVTPATADAKVSQKADDVLTSIRNRKPQEKDPIAKPDFDPKITLAVLPPAAPFHPVVPVVETVRVINKNAKLAEVITLAKPQLTKGRTTVELPPDWPQYAELQGKDVADWVTVGAIFDVEEMTRRLAENYGGTRSKVIYAGVELQRRAQRENGSWSDEDWADIEPWPRPSLPPIPAIPLYEDEGRMAIKSADHQEVLKFQEALQMPTRQLELYRPLMRKRFNGDCWTFPLINPLKEHNVLMQDDELQNPNQIPAANPLNRYPCLNIESKVAVAPLTEKLNTLERQLTVARGSCLREMATEIKNDATKVESDSEATTAEKAKAKTVIARANELIADINFNRCLKSDKVAAGAGRRDTSPVQLTWAIDGRPGGLTPGGTYQYRIRAAVFNPRAGEPEQFKNPMDATVPLLRGPWSEASDPVSIPLMTQFFVTTSSQERQSASVEIFRWFGGYWVRPKTSSRLELKIGEWIKTEARVQVEDPNNPGNVAEPLVSFDAQRMIADIDFGRPTRSRSQAGKGGVRFGKPENTVAVLLVNEKGELEERLELLDKNSQEKKDIMNLLYKPPRERP